MSENAGRHPGAHRTHFELSETDESKEALQLAEITTVASRLLVVEIPWANMGGRNPRFSDVNKVILGKKTTIIKAVKVAIHEAAHKNSRLDDYKVVWKQLQEIATPALQAALIKEFPDAQFEATKSKSTYPDLKMEYQGMVFAFDVKSNEKQKEPWYDIARLGTVVQKRLDKFDEEYDIVVKYDSESGLLEDVYFEPMQHTVGFDEDSKGVKYRPYDGHIRPKSWDDFDKGRVYWPNRDEFTRGVRRSQVYRFERLIKTELIALLTDVEKARFRKLFD